MLRSIPAAIVLAGLLGIACSSPAAADTLGGIAGDMERTRCADRYGPMEDVAPGILVIRTDAEPRFPDGATLRLSVIDIEQASNATLGITHVDDDPVVLPDDWRERIEPVSAGFGGVMFLWTGPAGTDTITVTYGVSVDGGPTIPFVQRIAITTEPCDLGSHPPYPPTPTPWPAVTPPPTATDDQDGSSPWSLAPPLLLLAGIGGITILGLSRRRQGG